MPERSSSPTPPTAGASDGSPMNVLLIGGGGREHALATRMADSPRLGRLYVTHPQNPGLASLGEPFEAPATRRELGRLVRACDRHGIGLVVIGPEGPLAEGFADALASPARAVFGPPAHAARLEADKAWAKQLMRSAAIPTGEARTFEHVEQAREYVLSREDVPVIKASGLAGGKGVFVCESPEQAVAALERVMVAREFGEAGSRVVIEERLVGPEVSVFALVDGRTLYVLPTCQDHKRLRDGDEGPNTGGMGAFCPSPLIDQPTMDLIERNILVPTIDALRREGVEYRGILYAGLILTHAGPKVLEFNVRFGDPECQALMARFRGDLVDVLDKAARGRLDHAELDWDERAACCVVLASEGYPERPQTGKVIAGLEEAGAMEGVRVDHAGTARNSDGAIVTAGGRVLNVTGLGATLHEARARAYAACEAIRFEGKTLRTDIADTPIKAGH